MITLKDKILILDGAMGTMIQKYGLSEGDYRCGPFAECAKELKGNNECLNLTHPEIIKQIHKEYIAAGADIIETNTFSANVISQSEYDCDRYAAQMALAGARIAREAADEAAEMAAAVGLERKVWVAGSMGPTSKSLSLSPDVSDPAFRPYSFDEMYEAYRQQAEALIQGHVDLLLIETCFDALNVKAALKAISDIHAEEEKIPVIISVSVGDRSGRTLTGQTLEAFYTAVSHYPLLAFGLNCSLGAAELMPLIEDISKWCRCGISCYPNAGLPNEMGGYDQSPDDMAQQVRTMAEKGLVNIVGGCCGTTPEHIRTIAKAVKDISPSTRTALSVDNTPLKVSGLETVTVDVKHNNFTNIGERTNVAGSRKFARLIAEGKYDEALQIAAKQIEDGAGIIDINMDDAMLDSTREIERFVRYISNDPAVAKAALMIDSSHWDTLLAGLKNAQGKCIVNSISLKEGQEAFISKAKAIKELGAAMVVMAFDEEGQATTYDRKIAICQRAYELLTKKAGVAPSDIIFDVNILSIGTGISEHARYAVDFIEAVRWIKGNLPGALTSGGVSNLSFAFRGNNAVREAMHSAFLYHAIKAGLDMAIVNPSMLQIYDEIEPGLLKCVEDVIFDRDSQATERLIVKATRLKEEIAGQAGNDERGGNDGKGGTQQACEDSGGRLTEAIVKGRSNDLETDLRELIDKGESPLRIIEGPLMAGMETVGKLFGDGKMFLPQVVKSAKVMRDAVTILEPYMGKDDKASEKPVVLIATVKGDVHDIGKNITGIVLTCNGFNVHDLGVMVDKEIILNEAERLGADIVAVSGLITPSLYQMEEICREMSARGMTKPLFIGGATTSALHTAVKLAPLYEHVYYGADASAAAVMAKKYTMDPETFEKEQHKEQEHLRELYEKGEEAGPAPCECDADVGRFPFESYLEKCPLDIPAKELDPSEVMQYFDWRMFYAIWGVKYGSASPEAMELMQLRQDAEDELALGNYRIMVSARFILGSSDGKSIITRERKIPFMRQETGEGLSLCDYVIPQSSGRRSPFGVFTICVRPRNAAHEEGCCCPACSNKYEDMVAKTVRMTLAEAASQWLDARLADNGTKIIKPAAGYSSCPDHTLKDEILEMLSGRFGLGIKLTESYAMIPESSICGFIFMHPDAKYSEIRRISKEQYEEYASVRGMDEDRARRFLGHLLK
ncbi:MAG: methionine synthase [Bacteroidales bacterium]|nr:methionine synthase [Bacteroidales bacterium]